MKLLILLLTALVASFLCVSTQAHVAVSVDVDIRSSEHHHNKLAFDETALEQHAELPQPQPQEEKTEEESNLVGASETTCTWNNAKGTCKNYKDCKGKSTTENLCPGGNDIRCCVEAEEKKPVKTREPKDPKEHKDPKKSKEPNHTKAPTEPKKTTTTKTSPIKEGAKRWGSCDWNGAKGVCVDFKDCTGGVTATESLCPGGNDIRCCVAGKHAPKVNVGAARNEAISRAMSWVNAGLLYCQAPLGAYDSACGYTCNRKSHPGWNAYRSDCSGLVSYAWDLPAPGHVTATLAPFETDVSHAINCEDLESGDAVNSGEHIMLFDKWITKGKEMLVIEEYDCHESAVRRTHPATCEGGDKIALEGTTYHAIRKNGW